MQCAFLHVWRCIMASTSLFLLPVLILVFNPKFLNLRLQEHLNGIIVCILTFKPDSSSVGCISLNFNFKYYSMYHVEGHGCNYYYPYICLKIVECQYKQTSAKTVFHGWITIYFLFQHSFVTYVTNRTHISLRLSFTNRKIVASRVNTLACFVRRLSRENTISTNIQWGSTILLKIIKWRVRLELLLNFVSSFLIFVNLFTFYRNSKWVIIQELNLCLWLEKNSWNTYM